MTSSAWGAALDDWESFLDALEEALDQGEWERVAEQAAWVPPADMSAAPTAGEQARALALTDRAGRLRERLEAALRDTAVELGGERRKAQVAESYLRADHGH
jgi:hypothetical protein